VANLRFPLIIELTKLCDFAIMTIDISRCNGFFDDLRAQDNSSAICERKKCFGVKSKIMNI